MRCVIIGGAPITEYEYLRQRLCDDDFVIYCDSGLFHEKELGVAPSLIVGDFDSHAKPERDIETVVLPREKDDTDTVFAVRYALERGYREFVIMGAIGARFDHTLCNISILLMLEKQGAHGIIADDYGELELVTDSAEVSDDYPFFSLLAIDGAARVDIMNAKFPLCGGVITPDYQYGVSNEPLSGGAKIKIRDGKLLLMKVIKK